jgi:uncharacterized membrane protein YwzB
MPGAKQARTVMIIVAIVVIGSLVGAMMLSSGAITAR